MCLSGRGWREVWEKGKDEWVWENWISYTLKGGLNRDLCSWAFFTKPCRGPQKVFKSSSFRSSPFQIFRSTKESLQVQASTHVTRNDLSKGRVGGKDLPNIWAHTPTLKPNVSALDVEYSVDAHVMYFKETNEGEGKKVAKTNNERARDLLLLLTLSFWKSPKAFSKHSDSSPSKGRREWHPNKSAAKKIDLVRKVLKKDCEEEERGH